MIVNAETGEKVELSQAEYDEVVCSAEESHTQSLQDFESEKEDYQCLMAEDRKLCGEEW